MEEEQKEKLFTKREEGWKKVDEKQKRQIYGIFK